MGISPPIGREAEWTRLLEFVEPLIYESSLDFRAVEAVSETRQRMSEKLAVGCGILVAPNMRAIFRVCFIRGREPDDVSWWLTEDLVLGNNINGEALLECDHSVLKELGIKKVGDRVRIFVAIKAFH